MVEMLKQHVIAAAAQAGHRHVVECYGCPLIAIDFSIVVFAGLPAHGERQAVLDAVECALDQVLELRRQMPPEQASDVYLMMAGPQGSDAARAWRALAAEIERDDRLARKHVWLPDGEGGNVRPFLDGTFLARPWEVQDGGLNALKLLTSGLEIAPGWQSVLLRDDLEGAELIQQLMLLERESRA